MAVRGEDTVYDLTILYMSDVTNWCEYLFDIFNPFDVYQQSEEITDFPTHESTIQNIKNSRVQVLIISPKFIETATGQISEITGHGSVVGLLCGVEREELVKLKDRIPEYEGWHLVNAAEGPRTITTKTLDIVDDMIKRADRYPGNNQDDATSDSVYMPMGGKRGVPNTAQDEPADDDLYLPMGGSNPQDIYLAMDGDDPDAPRNDTYDVPGTLPTRSSQCQVFPDTVKAGVKEKVVVIFTSSNTVQSFDGSYKIAFGNKSVDVVAMVLNPHTLRFDSPPELPGGSYQCAVLHNGKRRAKFKLSVQSPSAVLSEALGKSMHPVSYLCEVLGVSPSDNNTLDNRLHQMCSKYTPKGGFRDPFSIALSNGGRQDTIFPTALHFAAKLELPCVCATLCHWPGAYQALRIRNKDGLTPDQMVNDEQLKSFFTTQKEKPMGHQTKVNHGDPGYVEMTTDKHGGEGEQDLYLTMEGSSAMENDSFHSKQEYDFPFKIAIAKDEDIQRLVTGDADDIYNYFMQDKTGNSAGRNDEDDDDDDDDDTQAPQDVHGTKTIYAYWPEEDYETVDSEQHQPSYLDTSGGGSMGASDGGAIGHSTGPPTISRKPMGPQGGNKNSKAGNRDPDAKLQLLIDIQNRVKEKQITMDQAVLLFKQWEESHHKTTMGARTAGGEKQNSIQRFMKNLRPTQRAPVPSIAGAVLLPGLPGITPHGARGQRDIAERPDRGPSSPGPTRAHTTNGGSETANGDGARRENGSDGGTDTPLPPRSPRPQHPKDKANRSSLRNQQQAFSPHYMVLPIPPIPPRITSTSTNYSVLPPRGGGRAPPMGVAASGGSQEGESDHGDPTTPPPPPVEGGGGAPPVPETPRDLPNRLPPAPPRRRFSEDQRQDNGRSMDSPRRQSDPSVAPNDGEPTSPTTDPSGRGRRPVPRPRVPVPRPRP